MSKFLNFIILIITAQGCFETSKAPEIQPINQTEFNLQQIKTIESNPPLQSEAKKEEQKTEVPNQKQEKKPKETQTKNSNLSNSDIDPDIDLSFKQKELEAKAAIALSRNADLEIVWGKSDADYYIIDYGYAPNNLNKRIKVAANNLKVKGESFCYTLKEIPTNKTVYFTIQSISKLGRSKRSSIHAVKKTFK